MKHLNINKNWYFLAGILILAAGCRKANLGVTPPKNQSENGIGSIQITPSTVQYVPNELLVQFKPGTSNERRSAIFKQISAAIGENILTGAMRHAGVTEGIYLVHTPLESNAAAQMAKHNSEVQIAEVNYIYTHCSASNDPYFTNGSLWGMYSSTSTPSNDYGTAATEAWANGHTGTSDVIVAIIDEGVMNTHEDLAANCWVNPYDPVNGVDDDGNGYKDDKWGWDFVDKDNTTYDGPNDDHATHVAGTIGAIGGNEKGVAGVNWAIKMISCKFLGNSGGTTANAIKAVDYVTDLKTRHGMNIVATNNSWGGGGFSQSLKDAIDRAGAQNILFIAAAGNDGKNIDASPSYPASYTSDNLIAVAAINSTGGITSWSNYGSTSVDIGAPGNGIYSTLPTKRSTSTYGSYSGTSMATPHVTGAAALYAAYHSGSSAADIKAAILNSAIGLSSLTSKCVTGGRLDVSGF